MGIQLSVSEYAIDYLLKNGYDPQMGARPIKRLIQKEFVNLLSKKILSGEVNKSKPILLDVFDNTIVIRNQ